MRPAFWRRRGTPSRAYTGAVTTSAENSPASNQPAPGGQAAPDALTVRPITEAEHIEVLRRRPESSFLQNPAWGRVKVGWRPVSLGFFRGHELVGAALVLLRRLPVPAKVPFLGRACLAYVSEGPVLDEGVDMLAALEPMVAHLKGEGAFLVRVGLPGPVRRWEADALRKAIKDPEIGSVLDLEAEVTPGALELQDRLRAAGWQAPEVGDGFIAGQPMFQARIPLEGLDVDGVLKRMNQTSRSETRKSTRTDLDVREAGAAGLDEFMQTYTQTAEREGFNGRAKEYFEGVFAELGESPIADVDLFLASYEGQPLAGAIAIRQGRFAWYPYGGSATAERKRFAPRALQLQQIEAALEAGCHWYDLGGVGPSLDPEHKLAGLMRFKTAIGADVVQTHGEWELPLNKPLAKAFALYLARR